MEEDFPLVALSKKRNGDILEKCVALLLITLVRWLARENVFFRKFSIYLCLFYYSAILYLNFKT